MTSTACARTALTTAGAALAATIVASALYAAPAQAATYTCSSRGYAVVTGADFLKIRVHPTTSAKAVGQLARGVKLCFLPETGDVPKDFYYGYGYNGSTKVTGYGAVRYLTPH